MRTIWKYELLQFNKNEYGSFSISMPIGSKVLCVAMQGDIPCIWAEVDDEVDMIDRNFTIVVTGNSISNYLGTYIGTYQRGPFVWHLYNC